MANNHSNGVARGTGGTMEKELEQPLISSQTPAVAGGQHQQHQQDLGGQYQQQQEEEYNSAVCNYYNNGSNDHGNVGNVGSVSSVGAPRILDRDGTFSQSRGRWSIENNTNSTRSETARQRRAAGAAGASGASGAGVGTHVGGAAGSGGAAANAPPPPQPLPPRHTSTPRPNSPIDLFCYHLCRPFCCFLRPLCAPFSRTLSNWGWYFSPCCLRSACFQTSPQATNRPTTLRRCWDDWFHNISHTPTCFLMAGIFVAYFVTIVIFAGFYWSVNKVGGYYDSIHGTSSSGINGPTGGTNADGATSGQTLQELGLSDVQVDPSYCGMDINSGMEAMYFSLSTMATIGYGVSDYYFGDCWIPFILVLLQVFSALIFSSLAIGLLFQRMSRGQKRGRTIVFSDVAVVRKVGGVWYWMFRVGELRRRHVIGAKIRVFCVRHERCPLNGAGGAEVDAGERGALELETAYYVSHPLPLLNGSYNSGGAQVQERNATNLDGDTSTSDANPRASPAAKVNGSDCVFEQSILMGLPHVVVHRMDNLSPLMPPRPIWYDERGVPHGPSIPSAAQAAQGKHDTQADRNSTAQTSSEVSNESFDEETGHITENATSPLMGSHEPASSSEPSAPSPQCQQYPKQDEITSFLQDRQAEIIVFLEGTCEVTGMALQARHSYRVEDIAFHQTFAPCVYPSLGVAKRHWWQKLFGSKEKVDEENAQVRGKRTALEIDFCQFHDLIPAPYDCVSCPYVPSARYP